MKFEKSILWLSAALVLAPTHGLGQAGGLLIADPVAATDPVIKPGKKLKIKGKLKSGLMAIGGETTGWRLTYTTSKGKARIEVDMKAIKNAETYDGAEVTVTGRIVARQYIERGRVLILKAETVVPRKPAD